MSDSPTSVDLLGCKYVGRLQSGFSRENMKMEWAAVFLTKIHKESITPWLIPVVSQFKKKKKRWNEFGPSVLSKSAGPDLHLHLVIQVALWMMETVHRVLSPRSSLLRLGHTCVEVTRFWYKSLSGSQYLCLKPIVKVRIIPLSLPFYFSVIFTCHLNVSFKCLE